MRSAQTLAVVLSLVSAAWLSGPLPCAAESIARARGSVVKDTLPYLNVPYLWGGTHPGTGLDCSGFTQLVFHNAGFGLPRVARDQFRSTRYLKPEQVLPGDLIFFAMAHPGTDRVDHVGVYLGKGWFIHASVSNGVHVEQISKPYYMDRVVGIRKFEGF